MEITLTDAQYEELRALLQAYRHAKDIANSDAGEIVANSAKVEWVTNEIKFTISG